MPATAKRTQYPLAMDPIAELKQRLSKRPDVRFEETDHQIKILAEDEDGFDIMLLDEGFQYTVMFDGAWRDQFDSAEDAVNYVGFGLSDACRLRVDARGDFPYRCTVECFEDGAWQGESTTALIFFRTGTKFVLRVRLSNLESKASTPKLDSDFVSGFIKDACPGPNPAQQAANIIRYVGAEVGSTGDRLNTVPECFFALIGAPNPSFAGDLLIELRKRGLLDGIESKSKGVPNSLVNIIMRGQIRDSAFVIADLTHDNSGAYWEAGYAEGLGKPVIYICERKKFDEAKTHFDTNHCTTVLWAEDDHDQFSQELVATLRRSLNLFPDDTT